MQTVLIVVHLMIVAALVGVVLLQRSEGGGLGIGSSAGFMTARGAANALTRTTAFLAAGFFATSLALSILARYSERPADVLERVESGAPSGGQGILDKLGGAPSDAGQQPAADAKAADSKPADATAPAADAKPADATAPAADAKPADATAPAADAKPADATAPASDAKPADATAPAADAKPADATAPAADSKPAGTTQAPSTP